MFLAKKVKFHAWVQKCHFGKIEKLPKGDFLKKASRELNFFLFYVPMNPLKAWNAKLEAGIFLAI